MALKVCTFDAYGTLFDLHAAVARHAVAIGLKADALSQMWRVKQLEYSWIRSFMAPPADGWKDFWQLTTDALRYSMAALDVRGAEIEANLLDAYRVLDAFPDALNAVRSVKAVGMKVAILSNGTTGMIESAVASSGLDGFVDNVLSADSVRIFKPSPRLYELVPKSFAVDPSEICFVSSNPWDVAAAASFGFQAIQVVRTRQLPEYGFAKRIAEIADLAALPAALDSYNGRQAAAG